MAGGDDDWGLVPFEINEGKSLSGKEGAKDFCEPAPVSEADAVLGIANDTWFAIAWGDAPCANMAVQLVPREYAQKPDFWEIDVIGCVPGVCLKAIRPFGVWLDVTNYRGHKGIAIVGSNQTIKVPIP